MSPKSGTTLHTGLSGAAGEYFVAAELSRRGYIASVTLRNAQGIDILATRPTDTRIIGIQVKTNQRDERIWRLNVKAETLFRPDLFYVFVNLHGSGTPTYHIVPSRIVADSVRTGHAAWLATPGKNGQPHQDTSMRAFADWKGDYLEKWEILNGATTASVVDTTSEA